MDIAHYRDLTVAMAQAVVNLQNREESMVNTFIITTIASLLHEEPYNYSKQQAKQIAVGMIEGGDVPCFSAGRPCDCTVRTHMFHPLNIFASHVRHVSTLLIIKVEQNVNMQALINYAFQQVSIASREAWSVCFLFEHQTAQECASQNMAFYQHVVLDFLSLFRHAMEAPTTYSFHICMGACQSVSFISPLSGEWIKTDREALEAAQFAYLLAADEGKK